MDGDGQERTDRGRTTITGRTTGPTDGQRMTTTTTGHDGADAQRTDDDGMDDGTDTTGRTRRDGR